MKQVLTTKPRKTDKTDQESTSPILKGVGYTNEGNLKEATCNNDALKSNKQLRCDSVVSIKNQNDYITGTSPKVQP